MDCIRSRRQRSGGAGGDAPDSAAMTFAQIAEVLGSTEYSVEKTFKTAMAKLRQRPVIMLRLRALARDLEDARRRRTPATSSRLPGAL